MIRTSSTTAVEALLKKATSIKFNATLPVSIRVLKQIDPLRYLLQIGNQELTTKSNKPLTVGSEHYAQLRSNKEGTLIIKNMTPRLKLLPMPSSLNSAQIFNFEQVNRLLSEKKPAHAIKEMLLLQASNAQSKEEFLFFSQLLFSIHNQVISLPIKYFNKEGFLQFKKRKERDLKRKSVEFYAQFEHLGPMEGEILLYNRELFINISVIFSSVYYFLKEHTQNFGVEATISVALKKSVEPLFKFQEKLLDIKT